MAREDWDAAEHHLKQALDIAQQLGSPELVAFQTVKLGQLAQAQGDRTTALVRYQEGIAVFDRLGMTRESGQVRQMIASLDGAQTGDPLQRTVAEARAADSRDDVTTAITAQEQAVALLRGANDNSRDALVTLSVLLFNLAGYYGKAGRHADAVRVLEEVVALDEQTGHEDLASDRVALERAQQLGKC